MTKNQMHLRLDQLELAVVDNIKETTGLRTNTDAIRFAIRAYAKATGA